MLISRITTKLLIVLLLLPNIALSEKRKFDQIPADNQTMKRLMAVYSPPIVNQDEVLRFSKLKQDLADKKVVLVGEIHNQFEQHIVQLGVLKHLHEFNPRVGIGVEWIEAKFQPVIDQYLANEIDELTFIEQSEFIERWGYDYRMFRPILSYAKEKNIPIIALSTPREITKKISKSGMDSLSLEEKKLIAPKVHSATEQDQMMLEEYFTQHISDFNKIDRMIMVKRLWDETMTHHTLQALSHPRIDQMIVFTGINHIIHDTGMVNDLTRSIARDELATISVQTKEALDKSKTDYVVVSPLLYVAKQKI